jgi:hypothetical protein
MSPEGRALWASLPGRRLLRLLAENRQAEARQKLGWLLDKLRASSSIRAAREPRQLSLFYPEPPLVDQPWPCAVERPKPGT